MKLLFVIALQAALFLSCLENTSSPTGQTGTPENVPNGSSNGMIGLSSGTQTGQSGTVPVITISNGHNLGGYTGEIPVAQLDSSVYSGPVRYIWELVALGGGSEDYLYDTTDTPFIGYYFTHKQYGRYNIDVKVITPDGTLSEEVTSSWKVAANFFTSVGLKTEHFSPTDSIGTNVSKTYLLKDPFLKKNIAYTAVTYNLIDGKSVLPYKQQLVVNDTLVVTHALLPDVGNYVIMTTPVFTDGTKGEVRTFYLRSVDRELVDHTPVHYLYWATDGKGTLNESYTLYRSNTLYLRTVIGHNNNRGFDLKGDDGYMFDSLELLVGDAQIERLEKDYNNYFNAQVSDIKSDVVVKAHFTDAEYTVEYTASSKKRSGIGGIVTGPETYINGESFAISQTAHEGHTFIKYELGYRKGTIVGDSVLNPKGNFEIYALFEPDSFQLTSIALDSGSIETDRFVYSGHNTYIESKAFEGHQVDSAVITKGDALFTSTDSSIYVFPGGRTQTGCYIYGHTEDTEVTVYFSPLQ
ncbi:MAG: hypothetical protein OCC49_10315 [Fibrobacterales bacterium]